MAKADGYTSSYWAAWLAEKIEKIEQAGHTVLPTASGILIYPDGKIYASVKVEW